MSTLFCNQRLRIWAASVPKPTNSDNIGIGENWYRCFVWHSDLVLGYLNIEDINNLNEAFRGRSYVRLTIRPTTTALARLHKPFHKTAHWDQRHQKQKFGQVNRQVKILKCPTTGAILSDPRLLYELTVKFHQEVRGSFGVHLMLGQNPDDSPKKLYGQRFKPDDYTGCVMLGPAAFDQNVNAICAAVLTYKNEKTAKKHNPWFFRPCPRCNPKERRVMGPRRWNIVRVSNVARTTTKNVHSIIQQSCENIKHIEDITSSASGNTRRRVFIVTLGTTAHAKAAVNSLKKSQPTWDIRSQQELRRPYESQN